MSDLSQGQQQYLLNHRKHQRIVRISQNLDSSKFPLYLGIHGKYRNH